MLAVAGGCDIDAAMDKYVAPDFVEHEAGAGHPERPARLAAVQRGLISLMSKAVAQSTQAIVLFGGLLVAHGGDITGLAAFGDESPAITEHAERTLGRDVVTRSDLGHDGRFFFVQSLDPLHDGGRALLADPRPHALELGDVWALTQIWQQLKLAQTNARAVRHGRRRIDVLGPIRAWRSAMSSIACFQSASAPMSMIRSRSVELRA